jgi:HlyD family secretion protein
MAATGENTRRKVWSRKTWIILIGLIVAVIILLASISLRRSEVAIRTGGTSRETITAGISTNGQIEPVNNFEAHSPAPTTVKKIFVQQGDWVKPGQMLLQLDDASARAQAARSEAQLRGAESDISAVTNGGTQEEVLTNRNALVKAQADRDVAERNLKAMQRLVQSGAASQAEVDAASNQLRVAESDVHLLQQKLNGRYSPLEVGHVQARATEAQVSLSAARELLKDSNVATPIKGMVYSLPVRQGNFVNAGDLLVQVADLHQVRVRMFVDEPEIGKLQKGQPVEVTWDAFPGRVWTGTIESLPTNVVQRGTRMVGEVTCVIANDDLKLLPNTNVSVAVITARHDNALTVPRESIHQDASGQYVYQVVKDELKRGALKRRDVKTGVSDLTRVEVVSGLHDGAVLALGAINMQSLRDGLPVKTVPQ